MTTEKAATLAGEVLDLASRLDVRIREAAISALDAMVAAWAQCFDGQNVWLSEARDAVIFHYSKSNAFPIMPGDVIAFCARCPVYSSREHASDFLTFWAAHPYSDAIEAHTGVRPPQFNVPEGMSFTDERQFLAERLARWVGDNRRELVDAVMERRYKAVEE